jgi:hypothetical protein
MVVMEMRAKTDLPAPLVRQEVWVPAARPARQARLVNVGQQEEVVLL